MAEGLLRELGGPRIDVFSAGSKPSVVNPAAITVMDERSIDIRGQWSKSLDQYLSRPFDYVITVCDNAAETCPVFPGRAERIHWSFPDPAAVDDPQARLASFRRVRDALEDQLAAWVQSLNS
jgi:arsenate reductase